MDQHDHSFRLVFTPERHHHRRPLVLRAAAVSRRVDALFRAMSHDYLLREQFITDPAQVLADYAEGETLPEQRASVSNQLVYSILANKHMRRWLRDYAADHQHTTPTRTEFMTAFGNAVIEHGDHHIVLALIRSSIERESPFALGGEEQAMLFTSSPIFASGFLVSTDHRTMNDSNSTQNFEHSSATIGTGPGTDEGTEVGTDTGTHTGTDTGTNTGTDTGTNTGTDTGTNTGTDTGTNTGTHEGTDEGTHTGTDNSEYDPYRGQEYVRITIEALVQYALTLEARGVLAISEEGFNVAR